MIRKLSLAVALATALSPMGVLALGLGEIHTHSALNQYFKADIDLLSISKEELQDVRVGLASPEAFAKAGVDRPFLLAGLVFTPSLSPNGETVIAVTSKEPVREPFLNFLIEVNWPKGRLLREYTVLLDPPVTLARKPVGIEKPRVQTAPARQFDQTKQPKPLPVPDYASITNAPFAGAREYGPVQANDMLWEIARSLKQDGETVEQVMLALLRHNPGAFIRNNVNGLKKGKILRLPAEVDVTGLSPRQARREFMAQTQEWRQEREQPAAASEQSIASAPLTVAEQKREESDRLKLVSTKADYSDEGQDLEGKAEQAEKLASLEQQILLVQEESESARLENKELLTRVQQLEAQLSDIQRLLTLKSNQLTELQATQQIVAEKAEAIESVEMPAAVTPIQSDSVDTTLPREEEVIQEVDIEAVIAEAMTMEQAVSDAPVVAAESAKVEQPVSAPVAEPPPISPPATQIKPETAAQPVDQAPKKRGFLEILTGNTTLMGTVGVVGLLLVILLGLIIRRRKQAEAEFAESILVTPEGDAVSGVVPGDTGSINEPSEETSFMSDFSPSDIDALQDETGEVDPISEADVYIAYGRYQQAEELITQAMDKSPDREELKYKLLEIYHSAKNTERFFQLAEELRQGGIEKEKPDIWAKIAGMGKELDPLHAMFAIAATGVGSSQAVDELDDLGLNLDSELVQDVGTSSSLELNVASQTVAEDSDSMDLGDVGKLAEMESDILESDFSLDSEFLNGLDEEQELDVGQTKDEPDSLDIDLDELESLSESAESISEDSLTLDSTFDALSDLPSQDLDVVEGNTFTAGEADIVGLDDSESLEDLDLESLEKELEMLSEDLDDASVTGPESEPESAAPTKQEQEPVETLAQILDFDATDEVTTKLDLARAYVDMGDSDGAKSILEEVASEGSEEQKEEAQELLQNISG